MKLNDIYKILDEISPFELQAEWDNSGVLTGDMEREIKDIYLSLDADRELIETLPKGSLLIVHHPLIFKGIKELTLNGYPNLSLIEAIKKDISIVAMHTNYDLTHLNRYVLEEVLGFRESEREGFVSYFEVGMEFGEFAKLIKEKLSIDKLSVVEGSRMIERAALVTGSGGDLIREIKAECFLTGDIKYHAAKEASEIGLSLIDVGHFESERFFARSLQKELQNKGINGIIANSINPFTYI
jgi:dinuclear metal center YbgI/SA1388 family protein